ncbi:MAG TPA: HAD family hydrolase [Candidatus Cybelea sp.]|nr:HAD family hydrolase [Candidatus Cybelea sp.]
MDYLQSWNDGPAKSAIEKFVRAATDPASPEFVPEDERIATFDQDGTMWVEHPIVTQLAFALARIFVLAPKNPKWNDTEPFKSILARDKAAIAKLTMQDLEAIVMATHAGMATGDFHAIVSDWVTKARDPRWNRPYTELVYQPMLEVMQYLRANGFKVYIVTGGGQAFVRTFAQQVYGIPPERVIGSAAKTSYSYTTEGRGVLVKQPALLFFDDTAAKAEDIYLFLGRRPRAAFGNSDGDRQMLEYAQGNGGATLTMLVLHDDAVREYAYGPANGLPAVNLSPFSQATFDEATAKGWPVISMKNDWKRIFAFEP